MTEQVDRYGTFGYNSGTVNETKRVANMTTYTAQYTMYFFDEPPFEGYFDVEAESLDEAWEVAEKLDSDRHVIDVYES